MVLVHSAGTGQSGDRAKVDVHPGNTPRTFPGMPRKMYSGGAYLARLFEEIRHQSTSPKAQCFKSHTAPSQTLPKLATPFNTLAWYRGT